MTADGGFTPLSIITDADQGFPFDPEKLVEAARSREAMVGAIGLLRQATSEGRAAVLLRIDLPDGTQVVAHTTWRLFNAAARALAVTPIAAEET